MNAGQTWIKKFAFPISLFAMNYSKDSWKQYNILQNFYITFQAQRDKGQVAMQIEQVIKFPTQQANQQKRSDTLLMLIK